MKHTRWIALLLALVMVLGLMPTAALAAEEETGPKSGYEQLSFRVNPLYEGLIDEDDYLKSEITAPRLEVDQLYASYVTVDKAAATLRDAMEARKASVELHVKYESTDYNELIDKIFLKAFEHTGVPTEGDSLQWQYAGWSGQVQYDYNDSTDMVEHDFVIDLQYYTTAAQEKELTNAVDDLLDDLNVAKKSDYQKVCAVYDYICDNITYDYDNLEDDSYTLKFSAYAALVNKTAVCQGYALLFYRLMLELDVDARLIAGDGGGPHAWNIVQLGDVYYNLDSTWDAGVSNYQFFLLNTENFVDHARYLDYMTTQFHTDYPMSATDYVDGVEGEPEYYFVIGQCGDNAYFGVNRDRQVVIAGEGATFGTSEIDELGIVVWDYWTDGFDTVIIEEGVTGLGDNAFYDMDNVTSVTFPETMEVLGWGAFEDCDNIKSIILPDSVNQINANAFYSCDSLEKVRISSGLKSISGGAFQDCDKLVEVEIPEGIEAIYNGAFEDCDALTEISIPASVTDLNGFRYCDKLEHITLLNSHIGSGTFLGCPSIREIVIPETVTVMEDNVFQDCTGLEKVVLNNSGILDRWVFENCTSLKTVEMNGSITAFEGYVFDGCVSLAEITIPETVTSVGVYCFNNCSALKKIVFTGDAPEINSDAFRTVTATVYYPADLEGWTEDVLQDYGGDITWVSTHTHSYTSVVTAPTCTEKGYTTYTCSCGNSYKDNYVDALGHAYGEPEFIGRDEGHSYTCTRCGEVKTESCTFDNGTVVKEATLDEFGVKKHTCTVCGGSYETGDVYRIYGEGRVETALAAAELLKETLGIQKFNAVIIANGDSFADALTGSYLAARKDAPILLYRASGVALNEAYIRDNLRADGIIYILGGTAAVPAEVESSLRDQGYTVVRLAGDSRFDTNLAILEEAGLEGDEILVCTGWEFADSLSASATGMPILMVNSVLDKLTENQIAFLQAHADKNYTVIGGTAAVSDGLLEAIDAQTDGTVSRLYGNSREETSVKVAQRYFDSPAYALAAYSRNFPDGLCGGPLAHAMNAPLLLVNKKAESAAAAYVAELGIAKGAILGGTAAVSDASGRIVFGLE